MTDFFHFKFRQVHIHSHLNFGEYKCIARNILGKIEMKVQIKEGGKPNVPKVPKLMGQGNSSLEFDIDAKRPDPDDPLAITHYRFELVRKFDFDRDEGEWKNPVIMDSKAESNVMYFIQGLQPNTTYLVRVASINSVGLSDWTTMKQFKTLDKIPETNKPSDVARDSSNILLIIVAYLLLKFY